MAYLFGPVPSRRYGRSLGIDLVPMKTCCYDCVFCQLGPTPQTTCERRDYVPLNEVYRELEEWLARHEPVDRMTLCGSGEPTLHAHFGEVLQWIQTRTDTPTLLMSNGGLFADPEVRRDASRADTVKISLHFWDEASFHATVRPHPSLSFEEVYAGWKTFRAMFTGKLDLEFFALPGLNDAPEQLNKILALADGLRPDTITVNSAERPPAEAALVKSVPPEELAHLRRLFTAIAHEQHATQPCVAEAYSPEALLELARRHPLTPAQFARYFGQSEATITEALERLAATDPYAARALTARP